MTDSTDPVVKLAGKDYPVPRLVPKQQRIIIPALMRLGAAIKLLPPLPGSDKPRGQFDTDKLTTDFYDQMLLAVYWGAVWPNDRSSNPSIMDNIPVTWPEIMDAMNVLREQTGFYGPAPEGATPGESQPVKTG